MTRIIGDIHGGFSYYKSILSDVKDSIQVGDYGLGFDPAVDNEMERWGLENPQHRFIRGNHDNPAVCRKFVNYAGDYQFYKDESLAVVGGAWSIDYYHRKELRNWWPDEELSQAQFDEVAKQWAALKPEVVITHDAPEGVPERMGLLNPDFGGSVTTRTGYRLLQMFMIHQPKFWFFGHWHQSKEFNFRGTHFQCINTNSFVDFDINKLVFKES